MHGHAYHKISSMCSDSSACLLPLDNATSGWIQAGDLLECLRVPSKNIKATMTSEMIEIIFA